MRASGGSPSVYILKKTGLKRERPPTARAWVLFLLFWCVGAGAVFAQTGGSAGTTPNSAAGAAESDAASGAASAEEDVPAISEERQKEIDRLEMELRVSTLLELAELCQDLGISDAGTREELIERLRTALNMPPPQPGDSDAKIITIESARTTEYFTVEEVDEEYARLSGGVVVGLKDKSATYKIRAWEILYNKTRNIISASGGVEYYKEDGDTRETFRGESITINLDTWVGSFIDSISEKAIAGGETAYLFTGQIISQNGEGVTSLKKARITNAKAGEPYWSLDASRLWLMPGADWALLNAVLKVGEIPVLWLPAFFWPADEFYLHPVVGTRTSTGAFFQTTTYLRGQSKSDTANQSSISKIMGSGSNMEKVREGLFLRTTGRRSTSSSATPWTIYADAYAHLGFYLGTNLTLPGKKRFSAIPFSVGIGLSHDPLSGYNLNPDMHKSFLPFLPIELPFRYRMTASGSFAASFASFSWSFPIYSDPYIDSDFMLNRSETFDYFNLVKDGLTDDSTSISTSQISSYNWSLSGSSNIPVKWANPYISTLSIASYSTALTMSSRQIARETFYYPSKWTMLSINGTINGTPLTIGDQAAAAAVAEEESKFLEAFGVPRSPWTADAEGDVQAENSGAAYSFSPRALAQTFSTAKDNGLRFTFGYHFSPSSATELNFRPAAERKDIDITNIKSRFTRFHTDGTLTFALSEPVNNLFSTDLRFVGNADWQTSSYTPENQAEINEETAQKLTDYNATRFSSTYNYTAAVRPFTGNAVFGNSSLSYNLGGKFFRSEFNQAQYMADSTTQWDIKRGEWHRDDISAHSMGSTFSAVVFDKTQSLTLSAALPPLFQNYTYSIGLNAWISTTSISGSYRETVLPGQAAGLADPLTEMQLQPIAISERLALGTGRALSQSLTFDPQPDRQYFTNATTALSLGSLSANYTMIRGFKWRFDQSIGWTQDRDGGESFNPGSVSISYGKSLNANSVLKKLLTYNVSFSTSLVLDLQRTNYSRFSFNISSSVQITKFMDLSLSFSSDNAIVGRYIQNIPGFEIRDARTGNIITIPGETNPFIDLINSFNFANRSKREESGFKMRAFDLSFVHHLGDWDASFSLRTSPWQEIAGGAFRMVNEITFMVKWLPVNEIKNEITYNEKTNVWTQK